MTNDSLLKLDKAHVWHPYSAMFSDADERLSVYPVASADGVKLKLTDGRELIDGMSSWWCAIHGYNHPEMNRALEQQLKKMSHIMFGGLTHEPAVELATKLVALTPRTLQSVFFTDSGSVSVEVAMKMAIQYWYAKRKPDKQLFLTIRAGYHGDTFGAMSVCDPVTGIHSLFNNTLTKQHFVDSPNCRFGQACSDEDIAEFEHTLDTEKDTIAAVIMEPIVQGAGGMRFYSAEYLHRVRELCYRHHVLLILDEIATGFGRTGKLFAAEHANVTPDIMCVGKALTGGYMSLAATLTSSDVSNTISQGCPGVFMHGPTFMANPLACVAALTSLKLLLASPWQSEISRIEKQLYKGLRPCQSMSNVADVRVLGAIGVVELNNPLDINAVQPLLVDAGVWIRPFGKLIYLMPPFIINNKDLKILTTTIVNIVSHLSS